MTESAPPNENTASIVPTKPEPQHLVDDAQDSENISESAGLDAMQQAGSDISKNEFSSQRPEDVLLAVKAALKEVEQLKIQLKEQVDLAKANTESVETKVNKLDKIVDSINKKFEETEKGYEIFCKNILNVDQSLEKISGKIGDVNKKIDEGNSIYTKIIEEKNRILGEIKAAEIESNKLVDLRSGIDSKVLEIETIHSAAQKSYSELFTDSKNENDGVVYESIKTKIENFYNDIKTKNDEIIKIIIGLEKDLSIQKIKIEKDNNSLKSEFRSDFDNLKSIFTDEFNVSIQKSQEEINSLLPGAGAAGLASAYFDAKSQYGSTPYKNDRESSDVKYPKTFHFIKNSMKSGFFYLMFILPLFGIWWTLRPLMQATMHADSGGFFVDAWLFRIAVAMPLVAISWFGLSSIRMYRRLYEEYNHKQRVMQLYYSFKDEVSDEGQKNRLRDIMLEAVADKPSLVMSRYDKDEFKKIVKLIPKRTDDPAPSE